MSRARYSCTILMKLEFFQQIFGESSNFMKFRLVGAELFHVDGRTDRQTGTTKLIVAFHNFTKAPKKTGCNSSGGNLSNTKFCNT